MAEKSDNKIMYLLAYLFTWLTGLIVFLMAKDDPKAKFHGMQAILLGLVMVVVGFVLSFVLIGIFVFPLGWLYGMYVGYTEYSSGKTIKIPFIGDYAEKFAAGK